MDIRAEIQTRVDEIEQIIKRYLPEEEGWQKTIMCSKIITGHFEYSFLNKKGLRIEICSSSFCAVG